MKETVKKFYRFIPFKLKLFSFIKKFYVPNFYKYLPVKGEFKVYWNDNSSFKILSDYHLFMENELFWLGFYGGWEKKSLEVWIKLCKHSSTIFDVGANSGIYSLAAQAVNPHANIHAFEPIESNLELLNHNISINNFSIIVNKAAVSNKNGTAVMFALPDTVNYMTSINKNRYVNKNVVKIEVKTITLSTYIKTNNIEKVDLIKIDVEGHEFEVLLGLESYIRSMSPAILIEIIGNENGKRINELFTGTDYIYFLIDEINKPRKVGSIVDMEHHNYLICLPELARKINLI